MLPPTTKVQNPLERLTGGSSPFYLNTEARPWFCHTGAPRRAAVSAFGFGGSNFHCVLEEAGPAKTEIDWDGDVQVLAFSAESPGELLKQLDELAGLADWAEIRSAASRSRQTFRAEKSFRLVLVAGRGQTDWPALLARAAAAVTSGGGHEAPHGQPGMPAAQSGERGAVFCGTRPRPGTLAFLFPGQGSQYVGMLRDLACRFPRLQQAIARADSLCKPGDPPISSRIYPRPVFSEQEQACAGARPARDAARPAGDRCRQPRAAGDP